MTYDSHSAQIYVAGHRLDLTDRDGQVLGTCACGEWAETAVDRHAVRVLYFLHLPRE